MYRIRRIIEVYQNNIKIHDFDYRISMTPAEIPSVVDMIRYQLRTLRVSYIVFSVKQRQLHNPLAAASS